RIPSADASVLTKTRVHCDSTSKWASVLRSASRMFSTSRRMNRRRVPRAFVESSADSRISTRDSRVSVILVTLASGEGFFGDPRADHHPHEPLRIEAGGGNAADLLLRHPLHALAKAFPVVHFQFVCLDRGQTRDDAGGGLEGTVEGEDQRLLRPFQLLARHVLLDHAAELGIDLAERIRRDLGADRRLHDPASRMYARGEAGADSVRPALLFAEVRAQPAGDGASP